MQPPVRRPRRLVLAATVASVTVLCGSFAFVQNRADATWRAFEQKTDALRARVHLAPRVREPLHGTGTDDAAFAHYAEAAAMAHALTEEPGFSWTGLVAKDAAQLREATQGLRVRWQPALAALAAGARARNVARDAAPGDPEAIVNLLEHRSLCNFAAFEARLSCREGAGERAVRVSLDAATLGADLVGDGLIIHQMIGAALVAITVGAWPEDALRALDSTSLAQLAAGLEALDARLPDTLRLDREHLFVAESLRRIPNAAGGAEADWGMPALTSWRYGFSTRWLVADAFLVTTEALTAATESKASRWRDRQDHYERIGRELAASGNPMTAVMVPNLAAAEQCLRRVLVDLRLLRMAVDEHRGLAATPLDDPLGDGPFACERADGTVTWRSAGATASAPLERTAQR